MSEANLYHIKMRKYLLSIIIIIAGWLTSCQNNLPEPDSETLVTISVQVPQSDLMTRAGGTAYAPSSLHDMRVALVVSDASNHVISVDTILHHDFGTGSTSCTFETRLYKGKTYHLSVWSDFGYPYYTLPAQPSTTGQSAATAPIVSLASTTISANSHLYDAYFGTETKTLIENQVINMSLKRAVALVKVNTTDWDSDAVKTAKKRPQGYSMTLTTRTQFNLVSTEAVSPQSVTISDAIVDYDLDGTPKELHYNYLLANSESAILPDFTVTYLQGTTTVGAYTFTNIPVQRNYLTNITGAIFAQ